MSNFLKFLGTLKNTVYMEKQQPDFEYEAMKKKTLEQLRSGKILFGKDGAFAPMLKEFLESALETVLS